MSITETDRLNSCINIYIQEYAQTLERTNNNIKITIIEILNKANLIPDKIEVYIDLAEIEITCSNRLTLNQITEYLTTYTDIQSLYNGMSRPDTVKLSIPDY